MWVFVDLDRVQRRKFGGREKKMKAFFLLAGSNCLGSVDILNLRQSMDEPMLRCSDIKFESKVVV